MTQYLRYTLLADGASDRCLRRILDWALNQVPHLPPSGFLSQIADLRGYRRPPSGLKQRIEAAYRQLPCDIMFIHRDAEAEAIGRRLDEIRRAAEEADIPPYVPVVPVRMTEAWLLIDERAIRRAADNLYGTAELPIPRLQRLEDQPDPKSLLHECLLIASEKTGHRSDRFRRDLPGRVHRVADLIEDFSPLRNLSAFRRFEETTGLVVQEVLLRQGVLSQE